MKAKYAELCNSLADAKNSLSDAKISLSDAKIELNSKDIEISKLKSKIIDMESGDLCPICNSGRMKITASVPDAIFGVHGHLRRTLTCQNLDCRHSESRKFNPNKN
jgi:hypothetical protein